jgi:hypothetical protein
MDIPLGTCKRQIEQRALHIKFSLHHTFIPFQKFGVQLSIATLQEGDENKSLALPTAATVSVGVVVVGNVDIRRIRVVGRRESRTRKRDKSGVGIQEGSRESSVGKGEGVVVESRRERSKNQAMSDFEGGKGRCRM